MEDGTITIRTDPSVKAQLTDLAKAMDRSRNWVAEEAIRQYIELQSWQVQGILDAIEQANAGQLVSQDRVAGVLRAKLVDR